jgi:phosphoenolpyruvate carboxylase
LTELATGQTATGLTLDQAGRDARIGTATRLEHRPPAELSLEVEHAWATEALYHAHDALEVVHRTALRVAREHWPGEWTKLEPRLVTLASWVGYDQDGRTDMTWTRTIAVRLADKLAMLERWRGKSEGPGAAWREARDGERNRGSSNEIVGIGGARSHEDGGV